jgi:hypothetical protein
MVDTAPRGKAKSIRGCSHPRASGRWICTSEWDRCRLSGQVEHSEGKNLRRQARWDASRMDSVSAQMVLLDMVLPSQTVDDRAASSDGYHNRMIYEVVSRR